MDPATNPSDPQADRAASIESFSTRPNPFDDSDVSSRKRRRTSLSGSPARSLEDLPITPDSTKSSTIEGDDSVATDTMTFIEGVPVLGASQKDKEPDKSSDGRPSSRVTINLRRNSSPTQTALDKRTTDIITTDGTNDSPNDDGPSDRDSAQDAMSDNAATPSSPTLSVSPTVEVFPVRNEQGFFVGRDDTVFDERSGPNLIDPTREFPYSYVQEDLFETVNRLTNHLLNQPAIDEQVVTQVQEWLDLFLIFARDAPLSTVIESCKANRRFWLTVPDIVIALLDRTAMILQSSSARSVVLSFFSRFAALTARFMRLDCAILADSTMRIERGEQLGFDLFSQRYLQQLHRLSSQDNPWIDDNAELSAGQSLWPFGQDASLISETFQSSLGGGLEGLLLLTERLKEVFPAFPKFADFLGPTSQVHADLIRDALRITLAGQEPNSSVAKQRVERGHIVWDKIASALVTAVNQHVTHLGFESVSEPIMALTDSLKLCLYGDHAVALDAVEHYQKQYPDLPRGCVPEAISFVWRFDRLNELMRSSQLQFRVKATTTMCLDLVDLYQRLIVTKQGSQEGSQELVKHIGEYLLRTKLIDYMLDPNCHTEISSQSSNIIGFLVVTKLYRREHTEAVWRAISTSQDPRVSSALTRALSGIVSLLDYDALLCVCAKLQSTPIENYSLHIRDLWKQTIEAMALRATQDGSCLTFEPFDLCLGLLRESSRSTSGSHVAYPEVHHAAAQHFKKLLACSPNDEIRRRLYMACAQDLSDKSPTALGSLSALSMTIRPSLVTQLQLLNNDFDLTRLVIEELDHTMATARAGGNLGVLCGTFSYPRRDIICSIIRFHPTSIDGDLGKKLWDALVGPSASGEGDIESGWDILIGAVWQVSFRNVYLRTCFDDYLPTLAPAYFRPGLLEFIREHALPLFRDVDCSEVDERPESTCSDIDQLWRIILQAEDATLVDGASRTLAVDIYMLSPFIIDGPMSRSRKMHSNFFLRCLDLMRDASQSIKAIADTDADRSSGMDASVATDGRKHDHTRQFLRALQTLQCFIGAHKSSKRFSEADLRSLMPDAPSQVEGEPTELKYQSFDGAEQTEVKPLAIGSLNTAASLLASLKQATGFENYRAFYKGRQFLPSERNLCASLQDLQVDQGLILVKREERSPSPPMRIKPGSSGLEIEMLHHFEELWSYLSLDESIAEQVYELLIKLPAHSHVMASLVDPALDYKIVFPPGQPFKSLYAIYVLVECIEATGKEASWRELILDNAVFGYMPRSKILTKLTRLILKVVSNDEVFAYISTQLQMRLISSFMGVLNRLLHEMLEAETPLDPSEIHVGSLPMLTPRHIFGLLKTAMETTEPDGPPATIQSITVLLHLGLIDPSYWACLASASHFQQVIRNLLLNDKRQEVRSLVATNIQNLTETTIAKPVESETATGERASVQKDTMAAFFWNMVQDLLPETVNFPAHCQALFTLTDYLLRRVHKMPGFSADCRALAISIGNLLLEYTTTEEMDQADPDDRVARGLAGVLRACLQLDPSLPSEANLPKNLAVQLFGRHLFPRLRSHLDQPESRAIINPETRSKVYDVVYLLVEKDKSMMRAVLVNLERLVPFFPEEDEEPYAYELPYHFEPQKALRAPCGYAGMRNLSNTCYLNSLMTQLYMNPKFRQFILSSTIHDSHVQAMLFSTQKLFAFMQESRVRFVDPSHLVSCIRTYDDTVIDVHNQMDVDEFYNLLFDRWEAQLLVGREKRQLRSFYGGQLVQQIKSEECGHISERLEPFSAIQCDVKDKKTLQASLESYIGGESMSGENQYKCSTCDRHVDAVKRACLKDVPDNLIFHLKRFEFDVRLMQRNKVNDYFSFPTELDMMPYQVEYLSDPSIEEEDIFELVGVLVHSGTAESGHYYSYIRERPMPTSDQGWVEFNDDLANPWDPKSLEYATFGGPDERGGPDSNGNAYRKPYSAYMLFYQRASSLQEEQQGAVRLGSTGRFSADIHPQMKRFIESENSQLLRRHCIFEGAHLEFVQKCFSQAEQLDSSGSLSDDGAVVESPAHHSHELRTLAMTCVLSYMDQVVSRTKDLPFFGSFGTMVRTAVEDCEYCALSYYDYFKKRLEVFKGLLQRNPGPHVRGFFGTTLIQAMRKISKELPLAYDISGVSDIDMDIGEVESRLMKGIPSDMDVDMESSVLDGATDMFNYLWRFFQHTIRAWDEFFGTMLGFAKLGDRETSRLLSAGYLAKLLRIVAADPAMELPANYTRMMQNILRRGNGGNPSYSGVLATIAYLIDQLDPILGPDTIVDSPEERQDCRSKPFPWAADEVNILHESLDQNSLTSLFVEKLLEIDQEKTLSDKLLQRLAQTSVAMNECILNTLTKSIRGDTSAQSLNPFLRAASKYIRWTLSMEHAQKLILHICRQARHLQSSEGAAFLDFYKTCMNLEERDEDFALILRDACVEMIPLWAPWLLVYPNRWVRHAAEEIIDEELLEFAREQSLPANEGGEERKELLDEATRRLGIACAKYLREYHVRQRKTIVKDRAEVIVRVMTRCKPCYGSETESVAQQGAEFNAIQMEISEPLSRLIDEEADDDQSDWASCASSDVIDDMPTMNVNVGCDELDGNMT